MRRAPLLASALLAAIFVYPSLARAFIALPGCKDEADDAHLQEAVIKSRELAASCLVNTVNGVDTGLSPDLGRAILALDSVKGPTYHCDYKLKNFGETSGSHKDIKVNPDKQRPSEQTSVREPRIIDLTVFHELLHVVDPGKLRVSVYAHNNALGFPDGVNGCEYACAGAIQSNSYAYAYVFAFENIVKPLEQDPDYTCAKDSADDCPTLKKFARLCRKGAPTLEGDEPWNLRMLEVAICLKEHVPSIDSTTTLPLAERLKKVASDNDSAKGTADQKRVLLLTEYIRVLVDVMRNGSWFERMWLDNFLSTKSCTALPD